MDDCPICYSPMDMMLYADTRENTPTCFKLQCGHAYHTKCIIEFLSLLHKKCPQCNMDKTKESECQMLGATAKKIMNDLKQDEVTRLLLQEYKASKGEYDEAYSDLKNKMTMSVAVLKREVKFDEKFEYFTNCKSTLEKHIKSKMGKWNNFSVGTLMQKRTYFMQQYIFKLPAYYWWCRYKTPRINLKI